MDAVTLFDPPPGRRARLIAGGKAMAYLALAFSCALLATATARALSGRTLAGLATAGSGAMFGRALLLLLAVVALPTAFMLVLGRDRFALSGWAPHRAVRLMVGGAMLGAGLMAATAFVLWLAGAAVFTMTVASPAQSGRAAALGALLWLLLAAGEEELSRGYPFIQAARALSFWPAALLSAALFMAGHAANPGET